MTRRLDRSDLRRVSAAANLGRLPGRSLARRRGLCRQALIGAAGSLACAGGLALEGTVCRLGAAWTEAAGRVLIVMPTPSSLAAVLSAAGPDARRVDPGRVAALLGGPALLAPELVLAGGRHDPGLAARIEAVAPGSIVEADGGLSAERLAAFGDRLREASLLLLGAIGLASVIALAVGARAGVLASAEAARLLHRLGATHAWIGRHLVWPLAAAAGGGALIGLPLAAAGGSVGPSLLAFSLAVPFVAGLATALFGSLVARRRLDTRW